MKKKYFLSLLFILLGAFIYSYTQNIDVVKNNNVITIDYKDKGRDDHKKKCKCKDLCKKKCKPSHKCFSECKCKGKCIKGTKPKPKPKVENYTTCDLSRIYPHIIYSQTSLRNTTSIRVVEAPQEFVNQYGSLPCDISFILDSQHEMHFRERRC